MSEADDTISLLDQHTDRRELAAIRRLLGSEERAVCSCCGMPFDKGKRRRLIDSCGHERCYTCVLTSEICTLCQRVQGRGSGSQKSLMRSAHCSSQLQMKSRDISPFRLPPRPIASKSQEFSSPMTQSCPSASQNKKPFHCSRAVKNSFGLRPTMLLPCDSALSVGPMSQSTSAAVGRETESQPRWSSLVLNKIRSLWSSSTASAGLNQLCSDDEGGSVKIARSKKGDKKRNEQDLYTRLGLLLGQGARRRNGVPSHVGSVSSLASYDNHTSASANTSPLSTLTGSSEADGGLVAGRSKDQSSDSVGSLMSVSGHSTASSSPLQRRHSLTSSHPGRLDELNPFRNRRQMSRRSNRSASIKGPIDPKVRFAEYHNNKQQTNIPLKPLFFEVPQAESGPPLFLGREAVLRQIEEQVDRAGVPGVLVTGNPGSGKTALLLQMVHLSCFGSYESHNGKDRPLITPPSHPYPPASERLRRLASNVVAYHFCQADNSPTCNVADFIHSIAAQLCQAPQLSAYKEYLNSEPHILSMLSMKECTSDSAGAWVRGVLEPLCLSGAAGLGGPLLVLVDGLCEAEYHRPDSGHTIASFITAHTPAAPPWLKFVLTVTTHMDELLPPTPFTHVSLDTSSSLSEALQKDILDYINYRVATSQSIQNNIISGAAGQFRLCQAVGGLARGSMLFSKLTLDLIERGSLVAKSSSYKVLPVTLSEIYLLHFNLRFPTHKSFEKVMPILCVCLASLAPLTLLEIYYSVNSLNTCDFVSWEDFLQRFKMLSGFLIKRLDNTYMFIHPSFREWLVRRDEGESHKFLCDLRTGSLGLAMRLSRLEAPLDPEKTMELGHYILKAHLYKNMTLHRTPPRDLQATWVVSVSASVSAALASMRNIYSPNIKVSRLMLLSGADPDTRTDQFGAAPLLCIAAQQGNFDMAALLLEFGANPALANSQGSTPLILAAARGHLRVVELLSAAGAPLGRTDTSGRCALVHAARGGHLKVVEHLISSREWNSDPQHGDVEFVDAANQCLVAAAAQSNLQIVEYLLDVKEVCIDQIDPLTGETAVTMAASNGASATLSVLISRKASLSTTNAKGETGLQVGVRENHWECVERLIAAGAPLEQSDQNGRPPLIVAAMLGNVPVLELLLHRGAEVDREDGEGVTALGWACSRGKLDAALFLLERGAAVNHSCHSGTTPLDLATTQPDPSIVQLLLERGAMLEHVDIKGLRPLDRAISYKNLAIVQSLLKRGAKLGPTTWAMAQGKPDIILALLNKLLEDGNVLYRKSRLEEAAHRYKYALAKFPSQEFMSLEPVFRQLKLNFLLNYSRCRRKMNEPEEAAELATEVIKIKPDCYEAFYARAKAKMDLRNYDGALKDVQEALILIQPQNRDIRWVLLNLREEIKTQQKSASIDTLNKSITTSL